MDTDTKLPNTVPQVIANLYAQKGMRIALGITIIAIALLVAAVFAAVRYYPPASLVWSALRVPAELRNATFIASDPTGQTVEYVIAGGTFKPKPASALTPNTKVSPNGAVLAYAENFQGIPGARNPDDSRIVLTNAATNERFVLSKGFAPFFLDDNHVFWFTPAGLVTRNLSSGESKLVYPRAIAQSFDLLSQSPDRSLVIWRDAIKKVLVVYRVGENAGLVAELPRNLAPVTLSNNALYIAIPSTEGTKVWRLGFDGSEPVFVYKIPAQLKITSITL